MILLLGHAASSALLASAILFSPQFDTVADIPSSYYSDQRFIFGRVERVIDGDTVRVRHCPSRYFCENRLQKGLPKRIYDSTLSIRLYGIDCPELQKRSTDAPSQPFAEQAKQVTSNLVLGKVVKMTLLRKDQYGRALSIIETPRNRVLPFLGRQDLSEELLRRGLATIYTAGGAEYAGKRDVLENRQKQAQSKKLNMWSLNEQERVSPAEYKRQQRATVQYTGASN
jgi:micrococcal nuclease